MNTHNDNVALIANMIQNALSGFMYVVAVAEMAAESPVVTESGEVVL
jgi:hypothetical protein